MCQKDKSTIKPKGLFPSWSLGGDGGRQVHDGEWPPGALCAPRPVHQPPGPGHDGDRRPGEGRQPARPGRISPAKRLLGLGGALSRIQGQQ